MDQVSQHFSTAAGKQTREFDDAQSETSEKIHNEEQGPTYEEIYGMDEQAAKGEPIRGRRYMIFTMIAMLILIIIVGMNANIQALEKIRDQKVHQAVNSGIDRKKPITPTETKPKSEDKKEPEAPKKEEEKKEESAEVKKTEEKKEGESDKKEEEKAVEGEAEKKEKKEESSE